jgi:hypothetical protein
MRKRCLRILNSNSDIKDRHPRLKSHNGISKPSSSEKKRNIDERREGEVLFEQLLMMMKKTEG